MSRTIRALILGLGLAVATACGTTTEVKDIVSQVNATLEANAMVQASVILGETESVALGDSAPLPAGSIDEAIRRIDTFIAANPRLSTANNALTMRKAVLLLFAGQPNKAAAAFGAYDPALAVNERDWGLYRSRDVMLWWSVESTNPSSAELARYGGMVSSLTTLIGELSPGGIRDYLAATRAQIELKWARFEDDWRPRLRAGLKSYCESFDEQGRARVAALADGAFASMGEFPLESWRYYEQALITGRQYVEEYRTFLTDPDAHLNVPKPGESAPSWPAECAWLLPLLEAEAR